MTSWPTMYVLWMTIFPATYVLLSFYSRKCTCTCCQWQLFSPYFVVLSPVYTRPLTRIRIRIKLIRVRVNALIRIPIRIKVTRVSTCKRGYSSQQTRNHQPLELEHVPSVSLGQLVCFRSELDNIVITNIYTCVCSQHMCTYTVN